MFPYYEAWIDGGSRGNPGKAACAFVVFKDGNFYYSDVVYLGDGITNNHAEYQALLMILKWAHTNDITHISIHSDSNLIVHQVSGDWKCKFPLSKFRDEAREFMHIGEHKLKWVKGHNGEEGNEMADTLCNEILDGVDNG